MKKIIATVVLVFVCTLTFSQVCTPLSPIQCPDPEGNGEICPDWIILTETVPYNDAMTVLPPPTADGGVIGTVDVNWIQITAINNIPPNITYTCNPANCQFMHATYNCIAMTGTPPVGSFGDYHLDIVLDANVTMQSFPYLTSTQTGQHDNFVVYVAKNQYSHINIGNDTTILPSANVTYSLDTNHYVAALWNDTDYSYTYTFHGSIGNGVHYVSVKALDTLTWNWVTDTVQITVTPSIGIESLENNDFVTFYPDPTNGLINIEFGENSTSAYNVEIFNMSNQLVSKNVFDVNGKNIKTLDLSGQPKGVYYIRISNEKTFRLGKIILI